MERRKRKTYCKPKFNPIELDKKISLLMATEDNPPDNPFPTSSSSETSSSEDETKTESTKENNFDENPFQR